MSLASHLAYLANDPHWVYVIWNGEECVYVGMTSDWRSRTSVHTRDYLATGRATHIDVWSAADSRADAEALEQQTIRDLDPLDNRRHSPRQERSRLEWEAECAAREAAFLARYERDAHRAVALLPDLT